MTRWNFQPYWRCFLRRIILIWDCFEYHVISVISHILVNGKDDNPYYGKYNMFETYFPQKTSISVISPNINPNMSTSRNPWDFLHWSPEPASPELWFTRSFTTWQDHRPGSPTCIDTWKNYIHGYMYIYLSNLIQFQSNSNLIQSI